MTDWRGYRPGITRRDHTRDSGARIMTPHYPLTTAPDTEALIRARTWVVDADGNKLADCGILGRSHEENEAFAAKIVDALNAEHAVIERGRRFLERGQRERSVL